mgnify:CR=1 FL=1|uniref:MBL fold metallo-hydrolase n=1 Tax=candidate division CPR3 bacterium TaxID=2268181 RepID=A0A7C4M0I3_UNCC3
MIKTIQVGPLETNCYLIELNGNGILIDPGDEPDKILCEIGDKKIDFIILTHLHFDHIGAVSEVKKATGAKVLCSEKDLEILDENLLKKDEIDGFLETNHELNCLNGFMFKCLFVPGHTPGSICLYFPEQNTLFSGDTIFRGSIGVTHFKGGDFADLKKSIEIKLFTLPDDTRVYPGHGDDFILGEYKEEITRVLINSM